jgi:hypothetical protein
MNTSDLKELRISSLIEEITSNSLQIEQLSSDVRELMYAVRDLTEQVDVKLRKIPARF